MRKLSVTQARQQLLRLVDEVEKNPDQVVQVTKRGETVATILSSERLEGLLETLEILSDPKAMKLIEKSRRQARNGKLIPLEKVKKDLGLD